MGGSVRTTDPSTSGNLMGGQSGEGGRPILPLSHLDSGCSCLNGGCCGCHFLVHQVSQFILLDIQAFRAQFLQQCRSFKDTSCAIPHRSQFQMKGERLELPSPCFRFLGWCAPAAPDLDQKSPHFSPAFHPSSSYAEAHLSNCGNPTEAVPDGCAVSTLQQGHILQGP